MLDFVSLVQFLMSYRYPIKQADLLFSYLKNYTTKEDMNKIVNLVILDSLFALNDQELLKLNETLNYFIPNSMDLYKLQNQLLESESFNKTLCMSSLNVSEYKSCKLFLEDFKHNKSNVVNVEIIDNDNISVSSYKTNYEELIENGLFTLNE